MASVTDEREMAEAEVNGLPIDVETISKSIGLAWGMSLGTSTRKEIDETLGVLIGHLNLLVGMPLGEDENPNTLRLLRMVERHLIAANRPTPRTHAHEAYNYLRDTALYTSTLLDTYRLANGDPDE
ncbi:hypothetical protein ABZT34_10395 [Streptomyces sp. NPDC005329]|uniref:hypothetical protein n=1 Tax=Streptomyces sp. NPDC005329 TaxID=3157034 RepID=UPI0033B70720